MLGWSELYISKLNIVRNNMQFLEQLRTLGLQSKHLQIRDEMMEKIRYISVKVIQLSYAKDLLKACQTKQRRVERRGISNYDYAFEIRYHLSHYAFLQISILDLVAKMLNTAYGLGFPDNSQKLNIQSKDFIQMLQAANPTLVSFYRSPNIADWLSLQSDLRNYIAHHAPPGFDTFVEEKEEKISPAELEQKVQDRFIEMFGKLPESLINQQWVPQIKQSLRGDIEREENYRVILKGGFYLPRKQGGKVLFKPLGRLNSDYRQLEQILDKTLQDLRGFIA